MTRWRRRTISRSLLKALQPPPVSRQANVCFSGLPLCLLRESWWCTMLFFQQQCASHSQVQLSRTTIMLYYWLSAAGGVLECCLVTFPVQIFSVRSSEMRASDFLLCSLHNHSLVLLQCIREYFVCTCVWLCVSLFCNVLTSWNCHCL